MFSCAVEGCRNSVEFIFPSNMKRRQKWLEAIGRPAYVPKKRQGVCSLHFTADNFIHESRDGGFKNSRRILRKDAVPCVFMWSVPETHYDRTDYEMKSVFSEQLSQIKCELPDLEGEQNQQTVLENVDFGTMMDIPIGSCVGKLVDEITIKHEPLWECDCDEKEKSTNSISTQTQGPLALMTIEHFRDRPDAVLYYTGLESYAKFMTVLQSLGQKVYRLQYDDSQVVNITVADQLFIALWKLRRNCTDFELSVNFNVSEATISSVIRTWIKFMAHRWTRVDMRQKKKFVRCHISPPRFCTNYPTNKIILDRTEVRTVKIQNSRTHQSTFSTHKNRNPLEALIDTTSGLTDGRSTSSPQIIKHSSLLDQCDLGDAIRLDGVFSLQDVIAPQHAKINIPTFSPESGGILPAKMVSHNRRLAQHRAHVLRVIRFAKTFKILDAPINHYYVSFVSEIYTVIIMLCKFNKGLGRKVG